MEDGRSSVLDLANDETVARASREMMSRLRVMVQIRGGKKIHLCNSPFIPGLRWKAKECIIPSQALSQITLYMSRE